MLPFIHYCEQSGSTVMSHFILDFLWIIEVPNRAVYVGYWAR